MLDQLTGDDQKDFSPSEIKYLNTLVNYWERWRIRREADGFSIPTDFEAYFRTTKHHFSMFDGWENIGTKNQVAQIASSLCKKGALIKTPSPTDVTTYQVNPDWIKLKMQAQTAEIPNEIA